MKIIKHADIMNMKISPVDCYNWVSEMIKNKNSATLPPKISLGIDNCGFYNTMPVILKDYNIAGVKVVTRYAERIPALDSQIMLYDLTTGELKAFMDGNYVTAMRTGAVAAHAVKHFAVQDFKTLGMIGLGNTARAAFLILMNLYNDRPITVKILKYKDQHIDFMNRFAEYSNVDFVLCDTAEDVIRDSDVIISSVTYTAEDFTSDRSLFKEGCTLVPIHTRGFTDCDLFFDKVFADDTGHVHGFKNFDKFRSFAEVTDVINGKAPGRTNEKERILCYNIGIAAHDIFFAEKIFEMADCVKECELDAPTEKFWI